MNRIFYMAMLLVTWLSFAPSYADDVAQIGSTTYSSLADAIAAVPANGTPTTITMLADHVLASGVTVAKNQSIVIDLAGHTVSGTVATKKVHAYLFTNNGTLVIMDSSQGGTGRITYVNTDPDTGYSYETCTIYNAGNLTLTEGTIANTTNGGASYAVTTSSNAWGVGDDKETVFNMTGGTLTCPNGDQTLRVYQNSADTTTPFSHNTVTISGGRILNMGIFFDNNIFQPKENTTGDGISTNVTISGGEIHGLIDMRLRHTFHTSLAITGGTFVDSKFRVRKADGWDSGIPEPTSPVFAISGGQFSFASGNDDKFSLDRGSGTSWTSYEQPYLVSGGVFSLELPTDGRIAYPAGKEVVANTDANTMEAYPWTVGNAAVAKIGETNYASLAEAIAAVEDGKTITMLTNVTLSAPLNVELAGKAVTLDLGTHTLTGRTNLKSGSLTLTNGNVAGGDQQALNVYGSSDSNATNYSVLTIGDNVDVTAEVYGVCLFGATYDSNGYGAVVNINGTVTTTGDGKNGAVFVSGNLGNGIDGDMRNVVNITGEVTSATDAAVALNGNATVNVLEGAEITGNTGIAVKRGTLNVKGGTIVGNGANNTTPDAYYNGTEMTGAGISMSPSYSKYGPMSVVITGGEVQSVNADALFKQEGDYENDATIAVSGGIFSSKVLEEFCADGYAPADNGDGTFTVQKAAVAQIGDNKYTSLAEAIAAVPDGTQTTITMIADETVAGGSTLTIAATKNIVLDLNGKTITGSSTTSSPNFYFITNKGTLEITDNSEGALGKITYGCSAATYSNEYVTICNEGGTFTLTNGTIENTSGGLSYAVNNRSVAQGIATFNLNGGTISAPSGDAAIRVYQSVYNASSPYDNIVNVTGGTILNSGIFVDSYIGNNVDGSNSHLNVNISGGTVNGLIDYKLRHPYNIALNITGGTFVDSKLWVRKHSEWKNVVAEPTAPIVHISGGKFSFANNKAFGLAYDCGATSWTSYTQPYDVSDGVFNVNLNNFSGIAFPTGKTGVANTDSETSEAYPYTVGVAPVAQIGSTTYPSLAEAIAAVADGDEIKMIANSNENVLYDVTSPNLKNKTVTISGAYTLTSPDGSLGFYFGDYDKGNRPATDKLNVSGITMAKSGGNYTTLFDGVTADLTNVTVNGDGNTALSYANGAVGTLTNVTVTNTGSHTQTWRNTALALQGIGSGTSEVTVKSGSYTSVNGYAVYMFSSGGTLNIEGGTFSGALMSQIDNNNYPDNQSIINISGGTFANCTLTESGGENAQIYVSGGTFSINPTAYVLPGYAAAKVEAENVWKVGPVTVTGLEPQGDATETAAKYTATTVVTDENDVQHEVGTTQTVSVAVVEENNVGEDVKLSDFQMNEVVTKAVVAANTEDDIDVKLIVKAAEPVVSDETVTFEVHPEAIITVNNGEPTNVMLTNDDLAQGATFTFVLDVTGRFNNGAAIKVVHKSERPDETFYSTVIDGKVTVSGITHFSDFELSEVIDYVAQVDDIKFTTLEAAFDYATQGSDNTVYMLHDVTIADKLIYNYPGTPKVTLHLNNHTLYGRTNIMGGSLHIEYGHVVGGIEQALNVYGSSDPTAVDYSRLIIGDYVDVTADDYAICLFGATAKSNGYGARVDIDGINATVSSVNDGTVFVSGNLGNGISGDQHNVVNINNGTVTSTNNAAVALHGNATVNVQTYASITGHTGIAVKRGTLNVAGGTIVGNGEKNTTPAPNGNGTELTGAGISVSPTYSQYGPMSVVITGGEVQSSNAVALFKQEGNYVNDATIAVSGGIFSSEVPEEFCADGYRPIDHGNGIYSVTEIEYEAQLKHGETYVNYASLQDALAAAADGDEVYMLIDVVLPAPLNVELAGKAVTLDLGAHTLTGRTNLKSGSLTLTNGYVAGGDQQALNVYGSSASNATNYSVLTIDNDVNVTANVYGVCLFGATYSSNGYGAVVNINGRVVTGGDGESGAVFVSGNLGKNNSGDMNNEVNITGVVTSSTDAAVALNGNATVNVQNDAQITGNTGIAVKRGTLNVEGGTILGNGANNTTPGANYNGTEMTGAGISMSPSYSQYGPMSVVITGGTVNSSNAQALFKQAGTYQSDATFSVSGGLFSSEVPAEFCAEGYQPKYDEATHKYTVATFAEIWADKDIVLIDGQSYETRVGQTLTQDVVVNSVTYQRNVPNANTYCAWYVPADYKLTSADLDQFNFYRINLIANAEGGNEVENTSRIWVYLFPMAADDVLTANRPYVFKTKGGTGEFIFTLEKKLHAPATDVRLNNSTTAHNYDFYGTYETTELSDNSSEHFFYVSSNGRMGYPGGYNTYVGPYRWYIKTTQKGGGAYYAPTFVFTDDPNVTGITDNLEVKTIDCYYDLKGMKIEKPGKGAYLVKFKDGTVKKVVK